MELTREAMWERMMASDAAYDGRFITGVHSTGIYCLPSCRARKPKAENVQFYASTAEAEAAGFRPCKKCRPDDFALGIDRDLDILSETMAAVRAAPDRFAGVDDMARYAAMSVSGLFAAVRTHYATTPGSILAQARVRAAQRLLRTGQAAVEAGFAVGFDSNSAYYENFRRRVGMPPAAYRRLEDASDFCLDLPSDYRPEIFLDLLRRDPESLTERVTGEGFACGLWSGDRPILVKGVFEASSLRVTVDSPVDLFDIHAQVVRMLGLEQDPRSFEEHLASLDLSRLVAGREGLRIPQAPTVFDGLVWCIVGQQVNIPFASAMRRRLASIAGEPVGQGLFAAPRADRVAELSVEDLMPHQYSRRKAEYLIGVAQRVTAGTLDLEGLADLPTSQAEKTLLEVRGLGPWSANYVMMRGACLFRLPPHRRHRPHLRPRPVFRRPPARPDGDGRLDGAVRPLPQPCHLSPLEEPPCRSLKFCTTIFSKARWASYYWWRTPTATSSRSTPVAP